MNWKLTERVNRIHLEEERNLNNKIEGNLVVVVLLFLSIWEGGFHIYFDRIGTKANWTEDALGIPCLFSIFFILTDYYFELDTDFLRPRGWIWVGVTLFFWKI